MDDLVTRLRLMREAFVMDPRSKACIQEAEDEIKRLRKDLKWHQEELRVAYGDAPEIDVKRILDDMREWANDKSNAWNGVEISAFLKSYAKDRKDG